MTVDQAQIDKDFCGLGFRWLQLEYLSDQLRYSSTFLLMRTTKSRKVKSANYAAMLVVTSLKFCRFGRTLNRCYIKLLTISVFRYPLQLISRIPRMLVASLKSDVPGTQNYWGSLFTSAYRFIRTCAFRPLARRILFPIRLGRPPSPYPMILRLIFTHVVLLTHV